MILTALVSVSWAVIDPKCAGLPKPADYDEQVQQDFLQNYFALSTTLSAIHAPVPHEPGHGAIGVELNVLPPLGCDKRFVLEWTKTEDTNISPVAPRLRATFAFPEIADGIIPYAGLVYLPPVTLFGTRNVFAGGEAGLSWRKGETGPQAGARFHAVMQKTVADVASGFTDSDPVVLDLYLASTFGLDLSAGWDVGPVTPYVSVGLLDASTFFYVGDTNVVSNNLHPYFGPTFSAGVDGLVAERFRWGGEFYGAPGGYSSPDETADNVDKGARYGHLYTARVRLGIEL